MTNSQRLATVRTRFLNWLQDAGEHPEEQGTEGSLICRESMLIRDEFFCGRKFHARHHTAVWFIEEDVLKIYRADDSLELVLRGAEIDVCETAQNAGESGELANAADLQLDEQPNTDRAITEHVPEDASNSSEVEPRILKLATVDENGEHLLDSSAPVSDQGQANEQQAGEMDSGEQETRKAA